MNISLSLRAILLLIFIGTINILFGQRQQLEIKIDDSGRLYINGNYTEILPKNKTYFDSIFQYTSERIEPKRKLIPGYWMSGHMRYDSLGISMDFSDYNYLRVAGLYNSSVEGLYNLSFTFNKGSFRKFYNYYSGTFYLIDQQISDTTTFDQINSLQTLNQYKVNEVKNRKYVALKYKLGETNLHLTFLKKSGQIVEVNYNQLETWDSVRR